ncbi:MAG: T9SS type A sorting domain-containing protein, partial [Bacteroidia bacterium]
YAVRVTQGGCVDTSACYSVTGVGTSSTTLEENLLIYPLPMSDGGTVQFGGQGAFSLKLVDLTGKIVLFQNGNGTSPLFISTTTLKDGLYLLELESQTGVFIRKKAMILH